jgi:hypothetical protein
MKSYRKSFAALALVLALSASAFAGEMHTDGSPATPTTDNGTTQAATTEGEVRTGRAAPAPRTAEAATRVALDLLPSLLALI